MYLRFISPLRLGTRRRRIDIHMGIFQAAFTCRDDVDMPAWLHQRLVEEIDWFKEHLPSPDDKYFNPTYAAHLHPDAVCWFKASAKQFITHAWTLKALIEEAGLPMAITNTRNPGSISYQDKYQIVAHPFRSDLPKFG